MGFFSGLTANGRVPGLAQLAGRIAAGASPDRLGPGGRGSAPAGGLTAGIDPGRLALLQAMVAGLDRAMAPVTDPLRRERLGGHAFRREGGNAAAPVPSATLPDYDRMPGTTGAEPLVREAASNAFDPRMNAPALSEVHDPAHLRGWSFEGAQDQLGFQAAGLRAMRPASADFDQLAHINGAARGHLTRVSASGAAEPRFDVLDWTREHLPDWASAPPPSEEVRNSAPGRPDLVRSPTTSPREQPARPIGSLSEQFESRGPGTVSGGVGDPGGQSYGSWQLASRAGQPQAFLRAEGARWAREFGEHRPGTSEFNRRWRTIAERDPEAFESAQREYIARTHFRPVAESLTRQSRLDVETYSPVLRDVVWSTSVQHGSARDVLARAVAAADRVSSRNRRDYEEILINSIYDERAALVRRLLSKTRDPAERRTYRNILDIRYPAERREALRRLGE